jgi:RHS repeat-associated protein
MTMPRSSNPVSRGLKALGRWLRDIWLDRLPIVDWLRDCHEWLFEVGERLGKKRVILQLEQLEIRWLMATGITEYTVPTASSLPYGISNGPDGNIWFTELGANKIANVTTGGTFTETALSSNYLPYYITTGPDNNLWFTERQDDLGNNAVGKITTGGTVTEYVVASSGRVVAGITNGPRGDGNVWFTESIPVTPPAPFTSKVGKITTSGTVTDYATPTNPISTPPVGGITVGPDGNLWFTEPSANKIGKVTTSGTFTEYTVPTSTSNPYWITAGPDGNLWFTESGGNQIGRITTAGVFTEFAIPTANSTPHGITSGPDGALWFTESNTNKLGRITTSGAFFELALASGSNPESIVTRYDSTGDGKLWFTESGTNKIARLDYIVQATALQNDPFDGVKIPIPGQPGSWYAPHTGDLHVEVPLEFLLHDATDCGCNPSLAYNSDSVNVRPVISLAIMGVFGDSAPTTLQAQLTWNNGTPQSWVTISTAGHTTNSFYSFALQVSSAVAQTGVYPWQVEVQATLPDTSVIDRTFTGYIGAVVNDSTVSGQVDPFGPGWTVRGVDQLLPVSGVSGVPDGVLYVYGQGQSRYFLKNADGSYLSPANDFGTLALSGGTYTYTAKNQIKYKFDSTGKLITEVFPQNLTKTFTYSGGLLSSIIEPDGGRGTFVYTGNQLTSVLESGNRTVTITRTAAGGLSDLTGVNFPDNSLRSFVYDGVHRLTNDRWGPLNATYAYDSVVGALSTITLAGGQTIAVKPAAVRELANTASIDNQAPEVITDAQNRTTTLTLDFLGRVLQSVTGDGAIWKWLRDFAGNPTSVTDPRNFVTSYVYQYGGGEGDLTEIDYPDGSVAKYQYEQTFHEPTVTVDGLGNRTTMTYDATTGDLLTVKDALGRVTTYTYYQSGGQSNGLVQSITDPNGNVTSYAYDSARRLTQEIDGYGSPAQTTTTMLYDAVGNLLSETRGIATTNGHPVTTSYGYDAMRRVTQEIEAFGVAGQQRTTSYSYDSAGELLTMTDPLGRVTSYGYDAAGRQIEVDTAYGTSAQSTTTYLYDTAGNLLSQTTGQSSNATYNHPATTSFAYDSLNRIMQEIEAVGVAGLQRTTTTVYDLSGNVLSVTDPNGNVTSYVYDSMNRMTQEIDGYGSSVARTLTMLYDLAGNLLSETTGQSTTLTYNHASTTSYAYDALNRVTQTIDAFGVVGQQRSSTVVYDQTGNVLSRTDPNGNITSYAYDALNRVTQEIDGYGSSVARTATMLYDAAGNLLSETTGQSTTLTYAHLSTTSYAYDTLSRQTKVITAFGQAEQQTATMIYDAASNLLSETTGQSTNATYNHPATTSFAYDALNRRTKTIEAYGVTGQQRTSSVVYDAADNVAVSYDAAGYATTITYDALNRRVSVLDPQNHTSSTVYDADGNVVNTIDANNNKTTYTYNALNQLTQTTDPRGGLTSYVYDAAGNRVNLIDADNYKTTFAYNALNQLTQQIDPLGKGATFAYDAAGRLTSTTDRDGRRRDFSYDALNREIGETWTGATANTQTFTYDAQGNLLSATDQNGAYTYTMTYNALNQMTNEQEPFGQALTFTYDAAGNRAKVTDSQTGTTTSVYDTLNRLTSRQFSSGTPSSTARIDLTYTSRDQLATVNRYTDVAGTTLAGTSSYVYDSAMRLTSLQHTYASGSALANYSWGYDPGNRVTSETLNGTTTSYNYDTTNELTQAGTNNYSYDLNGNRTMTGYQTGTGNQLTNDGVWTYTYDNEGNLTKKSKGANAETWTYGYDNRNHLVWAKDQSQDGGGTLLAQATYVYDVFGNRIEKDVYTQQSGITVTSRFAFDGSNAWVQLDGGNNLVMRRLYLDGPNQLFARIDNAGTTAWYLTDRQGSVRDIVNYTGTTVLDHIDYDGFGKVSFESNATNGDQYKYNAGFLDTETGLILFGWRYDDPGTGRWTTQDPMGFAAGDANLYRDVGNDATNFTDPTGLEPNQSDAVTLQEFVKFVEDIEQDLQSKCGVTPDPYQTLNELVGRLKGKFGSQSGGYAGSGTRSGSSFGPHSGKVPDGTPELHGKTFERLGQQVGKQTGWVYLYTDAWGWIDLPHFTEAANRGHNTLVTLAGGLAVEYWQLAQALIPFDLANAGESASAFTFEDLPSNQLGSLFRGIMNRGQPLSKQLDTFFTNLGAMNPENAPDWNTLPFDEDTWQQLNTGHYGIRRSTQAWNRMMFTPLTQGLLIGKSIELDLRYFYFLRK